MAKKRIYDPEERIGRLEEIEDYARPSKIFPFWQSIAKAWEEFVEYRAAQHKIKYALARTEWAAIKSLHEDAMGEPALAIKLIEHCYAKTWQSIYRPSREVWERWVSDLKDGIQQILPDPALRALADTHGWPSRMWEPGNPGMDYFRFDAPEHDTSATSHDKYMVEVRTLFDDIRRENVLDAQDWMKFKAGAPPLAGDATWHPAERAQFRMQATIEWFNDAALRQKYRTFTNYLALKCSEV